MFSCIESSINKKRIKLKMVLTENKLNLQQTSFGIQYFIQGT